jgi:hypothetical protein
MATYAAPVLYAVLLWWFSTGLILLLDHAPRRTHPWSMAGATLLLAAALVAIRTSAADTSATGPRPVACAPGLRGLDRFFAALATSLWHEFAIVIGGLAILALVWGSPNRFALWTYGTLVVMNLSARLNLFLGVRNLHAEFLPDHLGYLACYLSRKPMNLLFPVSVSLGTIAAALLGRAALGADLLEHELIGFTVLATLTALATLEHWFLMLPLPSAELWRWSLPAREAEGAARRQD